MIPLADCLQVVSLQAERQEELRSVAGRGHVEVPGEIAEHH